MIYGALLWMADKLQSDQGERTHFAITTGAPAVKPVQRDRQGKEA